MLETKPEQVQKKVKHFNLFKTLVQAQKTNSKIKIMSLKKSSKGSNLK